MSLVAPSVLQGVLRVSPHVQSRRGQEGTHFVLLSLEGKESVTQIFPRATLY